MTTEVTTQAVVKALTAILDPDLHRDIVSLGFVKDVQVADKRASFTIELTTPACPVRDQLAALVKQTSTSADPSRTPEVRIVVAPVP